MDTGLVCDVEHSTCDGRTQMCTASGPGEDMFESTKIIAERQFEVSQSLFLDTEGRRTIKLNHLIIVCMYKNSLTYFSL